MGALRRQGERYRPLVIAVVAALVLVIAPDNDGGAGSASVTAGGAGLAGGRGITGDGAPSNAASDGPEAPQSAGPATAQPGAATTTAGESASTAASSTDGTAGTAAPASGYPGVGTPEALANANCDPQTERIKFPSLWAPPCVVAWPAGADNGGATANGITGDTIRLVWWLSDSTTQAEDDDTKKQVLASFKIYEHHYELWGRKLDVQFHKATGDDEVAQRADAIEVAGLKPYMAIMPFGTNALRTYSAELAARGVIVFDPNVLWEDAQAQPGYRWAVAMDDGMHATMVGEWVGKRINGGLAKWAGDPAMATQQRVFGLIHPEGWQRSFFDQQASTHGVRLAEAVTYQQGNDPARLQERARTHIGRLNNEGVTSVIAVTDWLYTTLLTQEATTQRYNPEWVITGWSLQDLILFSRLYDQQQWRHAFGIGLINLLPPPEHWEQNIIHHWEYGRPPDDSAVHGQVHQVARDIMAAFQLAGPMLTPDTFRNAMFGRPPAGGPWNGPTTTGTSYGRQWIGLSWDDYSGWDGMNETWWDPATTTKEEALYTEGPGAYYRLNGGKQYTVGAFPTGEPPMFDKSAGRYTVDKNAPEDEPPQYPHEPHEP